VYQFHSMEILHSSGPMLIPAILCAVLVAAAVITAFVLEIVAAGIFIDEAAAVAIFIVVEPISMSMVD
jgi:hypothetical protein